MNKMNDKMITEDRNWKLLLPVILVAILACMPVFSLAQESRFNFNEDITLDDDFVTPVLDDFNWKVGHGNVQVVPNEDAEDEDYLIQFDSGPDSPFSSIESECVYPGMEDGEIQQIEYKINRKSLSGAMGSQRTLLASWQHGGNWASLVFVTDDTDTQWNDDFSGNYGHFVLLYKYIDENGVLKDGFNFYGPCPRIDGRCPVTESDVGLMVLYLGITTFPLQLDMWHDIKIVVNKVTGLVDLHVDGEQYTSWHELGWDFGAVGPLNKYETSFSEMHMVGFGQTVAPIDDPTATAVTLIDDIKTTYTRACHQEIEPVMTDNTPVDDGGHEQNIAVGSHVGLNSGNLTVSVYPPAYKSLNRNYAAGLTYYSGSVSVRKHLSFYIDPWVDPENEESAETFSLEFFDGENRSTYVFGNGRGNDGGTVSEMVGGDPEDPIETGVLFYRSKSSLDYQDDTLRLVSTYGTMLPVLSLDESPYGRGWLPADYERLAIPDENLLVDMMPGGYTKNFLEGGTLASQHQTDFVTPIQELPADPKEPPDSIHLAYLPPDSESGFVGALYISNSEDNKITRYNHIGSPPKSTQVLGNIKNPGQIAVGMVDGRQWIVVPGMDSESTEEKEIYTLYFSRTYGGFQEVYPESFMRNTVEKYLSKPRGITIDDAGNIFVANYGASNILKINYVDRSVQIFTADVSGPIALACDDEKLYVLHGGRGRRGTRITSFTFADDPNRPGVPYRENIVTFNNLERPTSMTMGPDGNLYVSDASMEKGKIMRVFPDSGVYHTYVHNLLPIGWSKRKLLRGRPEENMNSIVAPSGVAFRGANTLYTAETETEMILAFDADRIFVNGPGDYSYITKESDGTYIRHLKHGAKVYFDADGLMTARADRNGNQFKYTYDNSFRITHVDQPFTNSGWKFTYAGDDGIISTIRGPGGRTTYFYPDDEGYGDLGRIWFKNMGGGELLFHYDEEGFLIGKTNQRNYPTHYEYDNEHHRINSIDHEGSAFHIFFPSQVANLMNDKPGGSVGNPVALPENPPDDKYTDPSGQSYHYVIDRHGMLLQSTNPKGEDTIITRDEDLNPTRIRLPDGSSMNYQYDDFGNVLMRSHIGGGSYEYEYDYEEEHFFPVKVTDPMGLVTEYEYDDENNLEWIRKKVRGDYGEDHVEYFDYTMEGQVHRFRNAMGDSTYYGYGSRKNTTSIELPSTPDGDHPRFEYSYGDANITRIKDPDGYETEFQYNKMNRLINIWDPRNRRTRYDYGENVGTGSVVDLLVQSITYPDNRRVRYKYDESPEWEPGKPGPGVLTEMEDPEGNIWNYGYDELARMISRTDPKERVTSFTYDSDDRVTRVDYPIGFAEYTYDSRDRVSSITVPELGTTSFQYNSGGNLTAIYSPGLSPRTFSYDRLGHLLESRDSMGNKWKYIYDNLYRVKKVIAPDGSETKYRRHLNGKAYEVENDLGQIWHKTYDKLEQLINLVDPEGNTWKWRFSRQPGRLVEAEDPNGRIGKIDYFADGQVKRIIRPDGRWFNYEYDDAGFLRLIAASDLNAYATYEYDKNGRVTLRGKNSYDKERFTYDETGMLKKHERNASQQLTYEYDDMDRVIKVGTNWAAVYSQYELDQLGRPTKAWNGKSETTFTYDPAGRVEQMNNIIKSISPHGEPETGVDLAMGYDDNNNLISLSMSGGYGSGTGDVAAPATFKYDSMDRLLNISYDFSSSIPGTPGNPIGAGYAFDELGRITDYRQGSGIVTTFDYDKANRLIGMHTAHEDPYIAGMQHIMDREFDRDKVGLITASMDPIEGDREYSYDPNLDHLLWATHPEDLPTVLPSERYDYDEMGKRLTKVSRRNATAPEILTTYEYNDDQSLDSDGIHEYKYDQNGNRELKERVSDEHRWEYEYDPYGHLVEVKELTESGGDVLLEVEYGYDWAGRRIEKIVNRDSVVRYAYRGHNIVAEYDRVGKQVAAYHHEPGTLDRPVAMERGGQMFYYSYDERGSVTHLTNEHGVVVQRYLYDAYGKIVLQEGNIPNPYTFTGRQWDPEVGLYHFRARAYDPEIGTFLQPDPVFSIQPYLYANNDPINRVDPMGLYSRVEYYKRGNWDCRKEITEPCGWSCAVKVCKRCPPIREKNYSQRCWDSSYGPNSKVSCDECWYNPKKEEPDVINGDGEVGSDKEPSKPPKEPAPGSENPPGKDTLMIPPTPPTLVVAPRLKQIAEPIPTPGLDSNLHPADSDDWPTSPYYNSSPNFDPGTFRNAGDSRSGYSANPETNLFFPHEEKDNNYSLWDNQYGGNDAGSCSNPTTFENLGNEAASSGSNGKFVPWWSRMMRVPFYIQIPANVISETSGGS